MPPTELVEVEQDGVVLASRSGQVLPLASGLDGCAAGGCSRVSLVAKWSSKSPRTKAFGAVPRVLVTAIRAVER